MPSHIISSESDVRALVRNAAGAKARWVEPGLGSTPGLPDCWVQMKAGGWAATVHLELKAGELEGDEVRFHVRPEQKKQIKSIVDDGGFAGLLVGIKGTCACIFLPPTPLTLSGKAKIGGEESFMVDVREPLAFDRGVFFIFSWGMESVGHLSSSSGDLAENGKK